jgi:hypothetical protein
MTGEQAGRGSRSAAPPKDQGGALTRTRQPSSSIDGMKILRQLRSQKARDIAKRGGVELARSASIASQAAMFCPSGIDVWMQRELAGCTDMERDDSGRMR